MKVKETHIQGLVIIEPDVFFDKRGFFLETYSKERVYNLGVDTDFVQDNLSKSTKHVLRGLHFQKPPFAQGKLVQVLKGAVLDVVVDIRRNSPSYGQHFSIELNEENKSLFFIPEGFAHGFVTLEDETIFSYKCTNYYNKESEDAIRWDDTTLNIDWRVKNPIVSEKDSNAQNFDDLNSPF